MTATDTTTNVDGRDTALEAFLDEHHVTWIFEPDLPLNRIDVAKSLANQARVGEPLIADVVDRYTADYQRGDTFPPLLARRTSARARLVLLGGNHRMAAATGAGRTHHAAYVVECTDTAALTLMYGDNRRHGMPPSITERCAQGAHLIDNGWSQAEAAAAVGVSQPRLSNYLNAARAGRRARTLDVGAKFDQLPASTKEHLARLHADPVFVETTKLAADAQLSVGEVGDLVKRLRKARSEAEAMRIIGDQLEEQRARIQNTKAKGRAGGKGAVTHYAKLNTALLTILDIPADTVIPPDKASRDRLRAKLTDAARRLMDIDKALA